MKKIATILALCVMSSSVALAQRTVDLSATMGSPLAGSSIISGQSLLVEVTVKNVGTNPLKATDTVMVAFYIDNVNNFIQDNNGSPLIEPLTGQALALNETKTISLTLTANHTITGSHQFCAAALPWNRSIDSVKDGNLSNNSTCNSVQFGSGTTSVHEVAAAQSKHIVSSAYPNPANGFINFDLKMSAREAVNIVITDLVGRTVFKESKGILASGEHKLRISTDHLPAGIYIYDISIGEERTKGKLSLNSN